MSTHFGSGCGSEAKKCRLLRADSAQHDRPGPIPGGGEVGRLGVLMCWVVWNHCRRICVAATACWCDYKGNP